MAVGTGGVITAGRALQMVIATSTTASTVSETWGLGGGAFSDSDHSNSGVRGVRIGTSSDQTVRSITIGANARLTGRTVDLDATVVYLNLYARASAEAYCPIFCITTAYADANIDLYSKTLVQVLAGAVITGVEGVDLKARHVDTVSGTGTSLTINRSGYSIAVAIIPPQRTNLGGTDSLINEINTDATALVIAGARRAGATPPGGLAPSVGDNNVALYVEAHNATVDRRDDCDDLCDDPASSSIPRSGDIYWDADVVILGGSGGQGYLVVGADGTVIAANGVQVRNSSGALVTPIEGDPVPLFGGRIVVGAISPGGAADIYMQADNSIRNQDYAGSTRGDPNANWPTFEFRNTLSDVTIVNLAAFDLVIEGVRVVDNGTSRNPRVVLFGLNGGQISTYENPVSLEFDLRLGVVASSYVDIEQRSATPKVLEIAGVIDNPIGLTRLVNLNGAITATGTGRVITNQLDAYAPSTTLGSIGSATARLAVDLVRYRAFPTLTDTVGGFFDPRLVVDAGVDAFLSLRGVDRTGTFTGSITTAGGNTLTRASGTGTWADDGFVVGDLITVFGLAGGNRIYQVTSVVGTTLGIQQVSGGGGPPVTGTATPVGRAEGADDHRHRPRAGRPGRQPRAAHDGPPARRRSRRLRRRLGAARVLRLVLGARLGQHPRPAPPVPLPRREQPDPVGVRPGAHERHGAADWQRDDHDRRRGADRRQLRDPPQQRHRRPGRPAVQHGPAVRRRRGRWWPLHAVHDDGHAARRRRHRRRSQPVDQGHRGLDQRVGAGQRLDPADQRAGLDRDARRHAGPARRQRGRRASTSLSSPATCESASSGRGPMTSCCGR